jgi:Lrp/AsnC family transcriptional regulator
MQPINLSPTDIKILKELQRSTDNSRQELAENTGLSSSTMWRRIQELEAVGAIRKRVALLAPEVIGVPVCIFVSLNLVGHDIDTRKKFERFIETTPEIMECFAVSGGFDYMLMIRTKTIADFESLLMEKILGHPSVSNASSQIGLRQLKYSTELPL